MAKFYGEIGYGTTGEPVAGVHKLEVTTRNYYGEIVKNSRRQQASESLNDDVNVSLEISILSDIFATENLQSMLYIKYLGAKWKISSVDISNPPRLILTIGGVYNG